MSCTSHASRFDNQKSANSANHKASQCAVSFSFHRRSQYLPQHPVSELYSPQQQATPVLCFVTFTFCGRQGRRKILDRTVAACPVGSLLSVALRTKL
jgi:hypothetical protein